MEPLSFAALILLGLVAGAITSSVCKKSNSSCCSKDKKDTCDTANDTEIDESKEKAINDLIK
ncbi:MAG: hypothetical protein HQL27_00305 [Candidatus Omnitrophica bacterium]|nr:hypothetical protein [Candidatus Omnitrophota bacterium]